MRARPWLVLAVAACSSPQQAAPIAATPAGMPAAAELQPSVFEVVIRKHENAGIQYAEELPYHLLPHDQRTDDYYTIGTAFTLDGKTFISAAHVFSLHEETQYADRQMRDAAGRVYDIDQFVRHSGLRDLVAFTVAGSPEVARPLARGPRPDVGATVYTVGNALGQGMSIRGGNVASFTPEPLDGAWQFIRYSAPASPGNSGGPLLDDAGRVVGVVVRRSNSENLNYAVPIDELEALSADHGDFYQRISEVESNQTLVMDWKFQTPLPADYATLAHRGKAAYYGAYAENRERFVEKFATKLFPTAPELGAYLRAQSAYFYPAELAPAPDGRWYLSEPSSNGFEVTGEQTLYFGKSGAYGFAVLERPDQGDLLSFYRDPKGLMDAILRTAKVERSFAGANIRVTSFGEPYHVESWRDDLGRPWFSPSWRIYDNQVTTLHCTPYPRGMACVFDESFTSYAPMHLRYARLNARRWGLSYDGRLRDWIEFLSLPADYRPTFLTGAVALTGSRVEVSLGPIAAAFTDETVTSDSLLFVDVEYRSVAPPTLYPAGFRFTTLKERGLSFKVERLAEPGPGNTQARREVWDKVVGRKPPYDGKIVRDGETADMLVVLDTAVMSLPPDRSIPARLVVSCWTGDNVAYPNELLAKHCRAFSSSLRVTPE